METIAIERVCIKILEKFEKLNISDFKEIQDKLNWVIGSYRFDKNPIGLYEAASESLTILKDLKKQKSYLVSKQLISSTEKALKSRQE